MCFLKVVYVVLSHFKITQDCVTQDISNGLDNPGIYLKLFKCFWAPENKCNNKYKKIKREAFSPTRVSFLTSPPPGIDGKSFNKTYSTLSSKLVKSSHFPNKYITEHFVTKVMQAGGVTIPHLRLRTHCPKM